MTIVDKFLIYFGGKTQYETTLVYACDLERMWWFVLHVVPDGDSVSAHDGRVSDIGLFMLPAMNSMSVVYSPTRRSVLAFLGEPFAFPLATQILDISDAIAHFNIRDDMLAALHHK